VLLVPAGGVFSWSGPARRVLVAPEPFSGCAHFLLLSLSRRYGLVSGFQFEDWRHPDPIRVQPLRLGWRLELADCVAASSSLPLPAHHFASWSYSAHDCSPLLSVTAPILYKWPFARARVRNPTTIPAETLSRALIFCAWADMRSSPRSVLQVADHCVVPRRADASQHNTYDECTEWRECTTYAKAVSLRPLVRAINPSSLFQTSVLIL